MKYKALTDCHIFGAFRKAGEVFEGPELTGYDKETAPHLVSLNAPPEHEAPPAQEPAGDYAAYTVAQIKAVLAAKGLTPPANASKAVLVGMLQPQTFDNL